MCHIGIIVLPTHCVMMSSFDKVQEVEYKTAFVETKCVKSRGTFYAYDTATYSMLRAFQMDQTAYCFSSCSDNFMRVTWQEVVEIGSVSCHEVYRPNR